MVHVACAFDWDHDDLEKKYNQQLKKIKKLHKHQLDDTIIAKLTATKAEIYHRVKNKTETASWRKDVGIMTAAAGGVVG